MSLYTSHYALSSAISSLFQLYVSLYTRPVVHGLENLPSEGAWIFAANHSSHADTAVVFTAIPPPMRRRLLAVAAKDYFFDNGLRQRTARTLFNAIPVDRENADRKRDPLRHVTRALREGYGVLIYPEGTRSRTGQIGKFRSGVGYLAARFPQVPVIPVLLEGTDEVMPKGKNVPRPRQVHVTFGVPMFLNTDINRRSTWLTGAAQVRAAVVAMEHNTPSPDTPPDMPDTPDSPPAEPAPPQTGWRAWFRRGSAPKPADHASDDTAHPDE